MSAEVELLGELYQLTSGQKAQLDGFERQLKMNPAVSPERRSQLVTHSAMSMAARSQSGWIPQSPPRTAWTHAHIGAGG